MDQRTTQQASLPSPATGPTLVTCDDPAGPAPSPPKTPQPSLLSPATTPQARSHHRRRPCKPLRMASLQPLTCILGWNLDAAGMLPMVLCSSTGIPTLGTKGGSQMKLSMKAQHVQQISVLSAVSEDSKGEAAFLTGFLRGGAIFGTLGYVFAPQRGNMDQELDKWRKWTGRFQQIHEVD